MAGATQLLPGLPDEITIWEMRSSYASHKFLLRCRAISPAWRRATSTRDFLLSHHARQAALPLLHSHSNLADGGRSVYVTLFDHRAGVAAPDRFQCVARLKKAPFEGGIDGSFTPLFYPVASYDGLLLLTIECEFHDLYICNPANQQYAPVQQHDGFMTVGMYPHPPTGQYRLLLYHERDQCVIYVFSIGSNQPPRYIGRPDPFAGHGLLFHGSLHWHTGNRIMVFDTTTESFRQIRSPFAHDYGRLFEMGDMLGIFLINDEETTVDIWVMHNYLGQVWAFKCRVELPVAEIRDQCQNSSRYQDVMVVNGDGELLVLVGFEDWLLQVDIDGKLIASFHARGLPSYNIVHKQTLVQHTLFSTLEGYVINDSPFI